MGVCASKEDRSDQQPTRASAEGHAGASASKNNTPSDKLLESQQHQQPQGLRINSVVKPNSSISQTNTDNNAGIVSSNSSAQDGNSVQNEKPSTQNSNKSGTGASDIANKTPVKQSVGMFSHPSTAKVDDMSDHDYKKVLLLGTGESGKSTILQQLKILHSNGFTTEELFEFKPFIFNNIITSAKDIVEAYIKFNLKPELNDRISEADFETILATKPPNNPQDSLDPELAIKLKALWENETTTELLKTHRHEFYLMDSAKYFFNELERIAQPDYIPNLTDLIRTRKKTSGIFDFKFELQGLKLQIFDVGGQRSERKKWIHCFDNVASIIFCVSLSEYDQTLLEDRNQNRLEESITLFDSVVNSRWFQRCSIILFLNKIDVFIEKLPYSPLENYFPDYEGGPDANRAAKYILWKFTRVNRSGLPIYPYITQATDTSNMKLVFVVVRESIFSNLLQDTGLLS